MAKWGNKHEQMDMKEGTYMIHADTRVIKPPFYKFFTLGFHKNFVKKFYCLIPLYVTMWASF